MAFEVAPQAESGGPQASSPDNSTSEIDRLLSEILNDPTVFSLIDSSPTSSSSSAPSPPCFSPSPRQLEQEALASLEQQQQQQQLTHSFSLELERCCVAPETPSPGTPSSSTEDHQTFFPPSPLSLPSPRHHTHPTSLTLSPPTPSPISPTSQQAPSPHSQPTTQLLRDIEVVIGASFSDPLLRGNVGRLLSLVDNSLARVFLYNLAQECQVPVSCVEFVTPRSGDLVRVIQGPLSGMTGWLVNCLGTLSHIQLVGGGSYAQVASANIAKLADEFGSPMGAPTSPHPLRSPTSPSVTPFTSPLLSPASLPSPNSHPHSPTGLLPASGSYPPPNANGIPYTQTPYSIQPRRPVYISGPHGAIRTPHHQNHYQQMTEIHRRRMAMLQQRDLYQRRAQQIVRCGQGNGVPVLPRQTQVNHVVGQTSSTSSGGRTTRLDQDYKSLVKYLETPTQQILDELRGREMSEYDFGSTGDGGELSSNCIQVPLTCPLSQRRMNLPCRGVQCKHPQCFDAEAYVEFNKCVVRPKEKRCQAYKSVKQQLFKCPLCSKPLPFSHLYIDKILLQILQETEEDEVEFDKTGSWKTVEKKSTDDVIDLTLEEEEEHNSP